MNVLTRIGSILSAPPAVAVVGNPFDDQWWGGSSQTSYAGVHVTPQQSLTISTFWRCHALITESLAQLPLHVFRERPGTGRDKATDYWLYRLLHDEPNDNQDAFEWVQMMTSWAAMRGDAYARKVVARDGTLEQLIPLNADLVTPELTTSGAVRYRIRHTAGGDEVLNGEDVFHLRHLSENGLTGRSIVQYGRQTVGLSLATEEYGSRYFSNGAAIGVVFQHPSQMSADAQARFKASIEAHRGLANAHKVLVVEEGMTPSQPLTFSQEDSQYILTREFQAEEVCRWWGVPPHMVGLTSKSTSWGTGLEQQVIGYVTFTLMPWIRRWESAINRQLIPADDRPEIYAGMVVDGLLRADSAARGAFYAILRSWGAISANEIRALENMNAVDGGDVYLQPLNYVEAGLPPAPPAAPLPANAVQLPAALSSFERAQASVWMQDAAARVIRQEIVAMKAAAKRSASDQEAWEQAVWDFYGDHSQRVSETMHVGRDGADRYCHRQTERLVTGGVAALEDVEATGLVDLVALALERLAPVGVAKEQEEE